MHSEAHNYFYVKPEDIHGDYFILKDEEFHHAVHVLRLEAGDTVTAVDGMGNEFHAEISDTPQSGQFVNASRHSREIRCTIVKTLRKPNEPILDVTLMQSLLKGDRFDYLVEKAVETGVNRIIPVHTERCVVPAETQKIHRYRRIAMAAMKQSCRSVLPEITEVMRFHDALKSLPRSSIKILLHKEGSVPISRCIGDLIADKLKKSVIVAVGPEGDFTREEIDRALGESFVRVSLGPRRLRSETAGLAAVAALLAFDV